MNTSPFRKRRDHLIKKMGAGIAIVPTASEKIRNHDASYPFRADSYFHYLTGFTEPEAVVVLIAGKKPQQILFCREKDKEREIWDGFRQGPAGAKKAFNFDAAFSIKTFDEKLPELIADQPALYFSMGHDAAWDARVTAALNGVRALSRAGKRPPADIRDVHTSLDAMRLIKDTHEISLMKQAAKISTGAHRRAMQFAAPGKYEFEIEAELLHEFRRHGSQYPAYTSIVAAGANACVLHYVDNNRQVGKIDLILIDAGCELDGYASDITRTFPANGKFSGPQRDIYELVLESQYAAIAATKPGAGFLAPHNAAVKILAQGMLDLKLLKGSLSKVLETESYKRFYMHRTSHWLGLDVHDAGEYKNGDQWTTLQPGMVLTIEPGCYVRPGKDVPKAFWNIGVRIEDDALVTSKGCEIITVAAPKSVADVEAAMRD